MRTPGSPASLPRPRSRSGAAGLLGVAALAAFAGFARPARASGLDAPLVGGSQSGPTTADAAAVHWNPAELVFLEKPELFMGAALVVGHAGYQRDRLGTYQTPDALQFSRPLAPANVDSAKTGAAAPVSATPLAPTGEIFFGLPLLKKRLAVGLGAYVPYAAALDFPKGGAQAWQLQQAFITAFHVTGSAAVRLRDDLSVGAGLSYVGGLAALSKLQDFGALDELHQAFASPAIRQSTEFGQGAPTQVRELAVLSRPFSLTDAYASSVSFNAGVAYRPTPALGLGLVYQHGADLHYHGKFAVDLNDAFFTRDLAAQGLRYKPLVQGDATLSFSLPKRLTLGASYALDARTEVAGFVSCVFYSELQALELEATSPDLAQPKVGLPGRVTVTLPRRWNDTAWLEATVRRRLSAAMLLSATVGYQSPASPDSTIDVASLDGHRLIGGLGGVLDVTRALSLSGDLRLMGILPRTVTTSDHDLGNGTYILVVASAGGHLKVRF